MINIHLKWLKTKFGKKTWSSLICTHDMLNEGLASWSDTDAMTCWGKPKQIIMCIKDIVEEYHLYIVVYANTSFPRLDQD